VYTHTHMHIHTNAHTHTHMHMHTHTHTHTHTHRNVNDLLISAGKNNKQVVGHFLTQGLPASFLKNNFELKTSQIDSFRQTPSNNNSLAKNYAQGSKREHVMEREQQLMTSFYYQTTCQMSGANTTTRVLEFTPLKWQFEFFALWPQLLRDYASNNPGVLTETQPQTKAEVLDGKPAGCMCCTMLLVVLLSVCQLFIISTSYMQSCFGQD
jgi:hypothetical protein